MTRIIQFGFFVSANHKIKAKAYVYDEDQQRGVTKSQNTAILSFFVVRKVE